MDKMWFAMDACLLLHKDLKKYRVAGVPNFQIIRVLVSLCYHNTCGVCGVDESRDGSLTHILRLILYEIGGGPGALFCKMHQALRCMSN